MGVHDAPLVLAHDVHIGDQHVASRDLNCVRPGLAVKGDRAVVFGDLINPPRVGCSDAGLVDVGGSVPHRHLLAAQVSPRDRRLLLQVQVEEEVEQATAADG